MRRIGYILLVLMVLAGACLAGEEGWASIFNGRDLDGWRASEHPNSFKVEDGKIVVNGKRGHLFYDGDVADADFDDFELKCRVCTHSKANSGVFIHTAYQDRGWPKQGYEVQVNATHKDRRKTGSIYAVKDVLDDAPNKDGEWFDLYVKVAGDTVLVKVDGEVVNEYSEKPSDIKGKRRFSSGTIALQAHDPGSLVFFKDIYVRAGCR